MAANKHSYVIEIGPRCKRWQKTFSYSYGSTKGICIKLAKSSACISASLAPSYKPEEMFSSTNRLFPDALRKCSLMHLIEYSSPLNVNQIRVTIDERYAQLPSGFVASASLIDTALCRPVPASALSDQVAARILKTTKSSQNSLDSALNAYLYSKSKTREADRLMYLWMAMNGVYRYLHVRHRGRFNTNKLEGDVKQIGQFLKFEGLGDKFKGPKDTIAAAHDVIGVLRDAPDSLKREDLSGDLGRRIDDALKESAPDDLEISAYGYLLMGLSYYYRCGIVHATKPLPLCRLVDDHEVRCMKICNDLMEEYLDENLFKWFDKSYVTEEALPRLERIFPIPQS